MSVKVIRLDEDLDSDLFNISVSDSARDFANPASSDSTIV